MDRYDSFVRGMAAVAGFGATAVMAVVLFGVLPVAGAIVATKLAAGSLTALLVGAAIGTAPVLALCYAKKPDGAALAVTMDKSEQYVGSVGTAILMPRQTLKNVFAKQAAKKSVAQQLQPDAEKQKPDLKFN